MNSLFSIDGARAHVAELIRERRIDRPDLPTMSNK
jgi:hypothetical protein